MFRFLMILFLFFSCHAFGDTPNPSTQTQTPPPADDVQRQLATLREENEKLKKEIEAGKKPPKEPDPEDDDLATKAKKQRESENENAAKTKDIERALGFNMGVDNFIVQNADLLPSDIVQIVKLAHKENYGSAMEKEAAIKAAMIQTYFGVQANLDALTNSQKRTLDDYLKMTKTGKEQKAPEIYENIFEPALETIRKVKKAEELGRSRSGFADPSDVNAAYKDRLVAQSRKTHLGEKKDA